VLLSTYEQEKVRPQVLRTKAELFSAAHRMSAAAHSAGIRIRLAAQKGEVFLMSTLESALQLGRARAERMGAQAVTAVRATPSASAKAARIVGIGFLAEMAMSAHGLRHVGRVAADWVRAFLGHFKPKRSPMRALALSSAGNLVLSRRAVAPPVRRKLPSQRRQEIILVAQTHRDQIYALPAHDLFGFIALSVVLLGCCSAPSTERPACQFVT